jgi:hypothetical protein
MVKAMTPEQIGELRRTRYNATVQAIRQAHSDLIAMWVRPDHPLPVHKAGQYTTLGLGYWEPRVPGCQEETLKPGDEQRLVRRSYSISCPILDADGRLLTPAGWLEFYIVLVREAENPPGLTPRLFHSRPMRAEALKYEGPLSSWPVCLASFEDGLTVCSCRQVGCLQRESTWAAGRDRGPGDSGTHFSEGTPAHHLALESSALC